MKNYLYSILSFCVALLVFSTDMLCYASSALVPANQKLELSAHIDIPVLRGLRLDADNPYQIDFIVDSPDTEFIHMQSINRYLDYFLTALNIQENKFWVNLSPNESDRIIDDSLIDTQLGKDILAQDYILKQLSASLTDPRTGLGKEYWGLVGTSPALSSAKIWIESDNADIFEYDNTVLIANSRLKITSESSIHDPLLEQINKEVNFGENFRELRQIYHAFILAGWFKDHMANTQFKNYINSESKSNLIKVSEEHKEKVYDNYIKSYTNGVYNHTIKSRNQMGIIEKRNYLVGGVKLEKKYREIETYSGLKNPVAIISTSIETNSSNEINTKLNNLEYLKQEYQQLFMEMFKAYGDGADERFEQIMTRTVEIYIELAKNDADKVFLKSILENSILSHIISVENNTDTGNVKRRLAAMTALEHLLENKSMRVRRSVFEIAILDAVAFHMSEKPDKLKVYLYSLESACRGRVFVSFLFDELIRAEKNNFKYAGPINVLESEEMILHLLENIFVHVKSLRSLMLEVLGDKRPRLRSKLSPELYDELLKTFDNGIEIITGSSSLERVNGGIKLESKRLGASSFNLPDSFQNPNLEMLSDFSFKVQEQRLVMPSESYLLFE